MYPRFAEQRLTEALEDSPVVLIQGPRQCGKTTLARMVGISENLAGGRRSSRILPDRPEDDTYFSFDDEVARAGAEADPLGFVEGRDRTRPQRGLFSRGKRTGPLPAGAQAAG